MDDVTPAVEALRTRPNRLAREMTAMQSAKADFGPSLPRIHPPFHLAARTTQPERDTAAVPG
jgi:hypothetical protein